MTRHHPHQSPHGNGPMFSLGWLALIGWLTAVTPAFAVIVFEKGKPEPIRGYLVSEDASLVVLNELMPGGETRERVLRVSDIHNMKQVVSPDRLTALSREQPQAYRDYAEELAAKREDPDARLTALRLFLIAAHLDPEKMGRTCLLGMVALARSPDEERKFRAMAFLLDSGHERAILREPARGETDLSEIEPTKRMQLSVMLRAMREGRVEDARRIARQAGLSDALARIAPWITSDDLAKQRQGARVPGPLLRRILTLELLLAGEHLSASDVAAERSRGAWATASVPAASAPIPLLSLTTVTEFDPLNCHFRDGKWVP